MDNEVVNIHQAPTIRPITKSLFFVFFCLAIALVVFRVSGELLDKPYPGMVVGYEVEVGPKTGGKIIRIAAEKNMAIESGQIVAELADEALEAEIASASAEIDELQDAIAMEQSDTFLLSKRFDLDEKKMDVESTLDSIEIDLDQLNRKIRSASEVLSRSEDRLRRAQILLEKRALTRSEYEAYEIEVESASITLMDIRLEIIEKKLQRDRLSEMTSLYEKRKVELLRESNETLNELELELSKKEGQLQSLLIKKDSLMVRADQSGVVSRDPKSVGEIVSAGQPIMYISTGKRLWVEASLPATDADALKEGDRVEIVAEKLNVIRLSGHVTGTLPILRTESRSSVGAFEDRNRVAVVMIEFDDPEEAKSKLRNGQSVLIRRYRTEKSS